MIERNESVLLSECKKLLEILKSSKRIVHYERLNSGEIFSEGRKITLCGKGTPDLIIILFSGLTLWAETKKNTQAKQRASQIQWELMISYAPNNEYYRINEISNLIEVLHAHGVKF